MRKTLLLGLALLCLAASAQSPSATSAEARTLYDDFKGKWLDPEKWLPQNPNCWGNVLECVREISNNKLRLVARNFGARDSDTGIQFSESEVYFTRPNSIRSIAADMTATFSGVGCSTNSTDFTHTQVQLGGTFFNTGSGNPSDDITVWLIDWIDSTNPTVQQISVYWGYTWPGVATDTPLATFPVGTALTSKLKWDKANHQFIGTTKVTDEPDGTAQRVVIPYPFPDTTLPAIPLKSLQASQHTLNCTSAPTHGEVEATFDNVMVNH